MTSSTFVRKHTLWVGLIAVIAPLVVLLLLQYKWLVKLEDNSEKIHKATLDNYLEAVVDKVEWSYREDAERVLNIGNYVFLNDRLDKAAHHFKKKGVTGVKRLFVASFVNGKNGKVLYFDPSCENSFTPAELSEETRAVWVAMSPLATLAHKGGVLPEPVQMFVDHRAPEYPMILNPITDDASRVVGVAGMILDENHFRGEVLPWAVKKSIPMFFSDRDKPVIAVWDAHGDVAFANTKLTGRTDADMTFSFVFTDWKIGIDGRHATAGQVAKRNFGVNLGLSALLAAALLGGIVLALRTASREMKLSEMKNDFVSNVSHELRTPLASIRVFGEFLRLGRVENPDKIREYGEYIETESRRLTQLINNLLDFASIESGRKSYKFERVDMSELVSETLKTFGVRLRQHGFRVVFDGPTGSMPPVRVDPGAIAQSLSNLLDNAVKYSYQTESKEIRVGLRREGEWIAISVQDHGIGIPRDEQKKIFDRFHRVGTGLVHDVKGSGLGLSIVQHIVQAHGGQVAVESRPGEGSTFSILLPVEAAGAADLSTAQPSEARP